MRKLSTDLIKSGSFTGSFSGSVTGLINSASYALTASTVLNAFSLTTGSTYSITASWGNYSISSSFSNTSTSSSYANTASNLSPVAQDLIPSVDSLYNLGSITNKWKDLYVSTGSIYIGNVSLNTSGSTLFANVQPIVTLNTASGQIEVSGITASLSSSFATNAGTVNNTSSTVFATTGSNLFNGNQTVQGDVRVVGNLIAEQYIVSSSVSYFTSSTFDGSTKFGDSSQDTHQFTGSVLAPNITGSLLGSSSYAETSSLALIALTSSYINVATNAVSSSYAATASISFTTVSSSFSNTSSLANTASYVLNSVSSSFASTSSYSLNSVSSSYSNVANTATSASYSLSASYAPGGGTTLTTGSTYPITSSWSTNAISSSFATFAVSATSATSATSANTATSASYSLSSSYSVNSTTATSSSFASTSSYNLNSISSSFSNNALTASYVENSVSSSYALTASFSLNGGGGGTTLTTGSTYPITSSWANNVITASYALVAGSGGGSTPAVSVASLNNQTILYNFSSSQEATITGLTLTNNNWGINVVEEWNSGSGDIYFNSCSLLMHFSGSNNSTTFIDSSPNNFTVTSNNGAVISTAQSKFGGASCFFDGTNDYLSIPDNSAFDFVASDFTIECWLYPTSHPTTVYLLGQSSNTDYAPVLLYLFNGRPGIAASTNGSAWVINNYIASALTLNTWSHLALVRYGNKWSIYVNGTENVIAASTSATLYNSTDPFGIGGEAAGSLTFPYAGYIDELRITKGVARYTASFVTQSVEFPNQLPQYETKYVGLVGGLNDTGSDYGVQKLDDSSLKIRKMSVSGTPISGSPVLSASVDRVYVNVLNYNNISAGSTLLGQAFTAVGNTASYALSRSVINPYEIIVAVDGAVQAFNDAYSVTSSTINFTESIPSGSLVDIRYLTTPNVNSASYAATSSYSLSGGTTSGKSIALSFILG